MHLNSSRSDMDADYAELRSLIDRQADGILVVDGAGLVRFANAAAASLFARDLDRLVGMGLGLPLVAGESTNIDLIRPDGSTLEVEMRVAETVWNGDPALLASLRDISERRQLEDQLRHAQKMEAVGRLTAGVAHDFNNLLTIVLGNLDTIQRRLPQELDDPRLTRAIAHATSGAMRAADLTQQLLAYSRRQPLTPRAVDLGPLLNGMDDLLTRTLGAAISVSIDVAPGTWLVMADSSQLEAALINLAVNARDAMSGGGRLSIRARNCAEEDLADVGAGEFVCLSVSDTGDGIPAEVAQQVFDPFFTTKGVGRGTGLGLSQVQGFARQSLGHVRLASEVGKGTTIRLYLPRHHGTLEEREEVAEQSSDPAGRTILLVEGDDDLRERARTLLRDMGYDVIEAKSGTQALTIVESGQPLMLMVADITLPGGMDGDALAARARLLRPGMNLLLTAAHAGDALFDDGPQARGLQLLAKPYSRVQLADAIASLTPGLSPRVLLVEDDPAVRLTLADNLRGLGCIVEEIATATLAMQRISDVKRPIRAAIIDLELPDGNGLALIDALRQAHPHAAVVVASGYMDADQMRRIEADGHTAILDKPFSGQDLRDLFSRFRLIEPDGKAD
ncbi:response regulator [Sphingobium mellinum]|uniref:response regulator n=1 Tax=Sphingobium mellinum TaxID=1387166 RepID=UPI0030EC2D85